MRSGILFILSFFLLCSSAIAQDAMNDAQNNAQNDAPRGVLPGDRKFDIFTATPGQIDQALKTTELCKSSPHMSTFYDCDCLGMKFLSLLQQRGNSVSSTTLLIDAQKTCPNAPDVAGTTLAQCETWARNIRPYSYQPFCACFASEYAKQFQKNTTYDPMVRQSQLTYAYKVCDKGVHLRDRLARQSIIQRLKEKGIFGALFPGAEQQNEKPLSYNEQRKLKMEENGE